MYGCESWTVKKAECQRIDDFELRCWRRLLRVPWTARRSNQSILKQISPGISLEGLMLKLKLQYFGHLMQRVDSLEKTLMLGGIGGRRKRGWQRMRWLDGITDLMSLSELWELVINREAWHAAIHGIAKSQTLLWLNWTELNWEIVKDMEAWCAAVHRVTKSWTWLSDWTVQGGNRFSPSILEIEKYVVSYFLSGQGQSSSLHCPPIDILEFVSTRTQLELLTMGGGRVDLSPASYSFLFHLFLLVFFFFNVHS